MPKMEVYVRGDIPPSQLVQRIRQTVAASLPLGERIRHWGGHTGGGREGDTEMVRYLVEYESEPGR
ncbi:hypothetical protein [Mycobacterium sp.]|uniref:hypothetical protein n=1 Tax=Mycobacterium sp. TaxID=1785 RepID=UPI002BDAB895|nr:hypothetical protein [Mycobacterium sp.]HME49489.1 hypothetical protein [Mycobacterium sp.]